MQPAGARLRVEGGMIGKAGKDRRAGRDGGQRGRPVLQRPGAAEIPEAGCDRTPGDRCAADALCPGLPAGAFQADPRGTPPRCRPPATATGGRSWPRSTAWTWPARCWRWSSEEEGFRLTGFIRPAALTRSNRKEITFFVNGRWVQDTPLTAALLQAYHTLLMVGRYPLAALFLEVPPEEVDVNVHPAKAEVRFRNPDKVFSFVQRSARRALLAYTPVPQVATQNLWGSAPSQPRTIDPTWSLAHDADRATGEQWMAEAGDRAEGNRQRPASRSRPNHPHSPKCRSCA